VLISYSNVGFVSAHFLLVSASFLLCVSPLFFLLKTSLFLSSSTKKEAQKHTTDYEKERENDRLLFIFFKQRRRVKTMKFSKFSFFAFLTMLFFHQARVNVVQAAPAMMFFSPPPVAQSSSCERRRRKSNGILIDAFEIIQGNRRQRRPLRRTSTKRANGFREAFGGRFVPVGE
jgi:hypothetical protein